MREAADCQLEMALLERGCPKVLRSSGTKSGRSSFCARK